MSQPNERLLTLRPGRAEDAAEILRLIRELADYEKLSHACIATVELLSEHLFGPNPAAETLVAEIESGGDPRLVGYAIFF